MIATCVAIQSVYATPVPTGWRSGQPVSAVTPAVAWSVKPKPRKPACGPVCPSIDIDAIIKSGLTARRSSHPSPIRLRKPGANDSVTTSDTATSRLATSTARGCCKFSAMPRLPRLNLAKYALPSNERSPCGRGPPERNVSGLSDDSIRITSAP